MGTHACGNGKRGLRDNHTENWTFSYIMKSWAQEVGRWRINFPQKVLTSYVNCTFSKIFTVQGAHFS